MSVGVDDRKHREMLVAALVEAEQQIQAAVKRGDARTAHEWKQKALALEEVARQLMVRPTGLPS